MSQQEVNKQSYLNQVKADESNMSKVAKLDAEIDQFVKKQKEKMAEYGSHLNLPERIHKKRITAEDFTILTKEQVEAGRPKDAYDYVL